MKAFMGNTSLHPHCKEANCKNCPHFTPRLYGFKVPKWIGNALFWFEYKLIERSISINSCKF